MPAIDSCEPAVIAALAKAGYEVLNNPYFIRVIRKEVTLFADLRLIHRSDPNQVIFVVEVKCFSESQSVQAELYTAIGQYALYRQALTDNNSGIPIYLAVPSEIYHSYLSQELIHNTLRTLDIKMIVIDLEAEEVVAWTTT